MMSSTKNGEIFRTLEVCREIIDREGNNNRGMYFLIAFLNNQGRSLKEIMDVMEKYSMNFNLRKQCLVNIPK